MIVLYAFEYDERNTNILIHTITCTHKSYS